MGEDKGKGKDDEGKDERSKVEAEIGMRE